MPSTRTTSAGSSAGSASGWYVDPEDSAETGAQAETGLVDGGDRDAMQPAPAGAVAAARAFLSAVESQVESQVESRVSNAPAAPRSSVRFVAEDDPDEATESTSDTEGSTGRRKPPPVRQASINALARKGMSSAEMTDLLEAREVEPDEVVAEVQRLEAAGLLDDRVLAEHLVRSLQERKGLGRSAITSELRRRKVAQAAIDEALETVDVDDELDRCLEVAVKRASQLRSYDRATAERRLSAFLMRRGYAGSVISAAVAQALGPVGPRFR
jgi:regulatory protein